MVSAGEREKEAQNQSSEEGSNRERVIEGKKAEENRCSDIFHDERKQKKGNRWIALIPLGGVDWRCLTPKRESEEKNGAAFKQTRTQCSP